MRLTDRLAADDERKRLLVVHRHTAECFANEARGTGRIRIAAWALGVHVDEAHMVGAHRALDLRVARVALVSQPGVFGAPEDLVRLPLVLAPEAEAERLEAHR